MPVVWSKHGPANRLFQIFFEIPGAGVQSSLRSPGKKFVCPSFVLREIRIASHLVFKHGNPGNLQDQDSNSEGPDYAKPAARNPGSHEPNAPPLHDFSKVVGMPGISP